MKKILSVIFVCLCLQMQASALETVTLGSMPKEQIEINKKPKIVKGSLLISDDEMLEDLIQLQKTKDLEDIEMLWKGTVENNKVIGFALKKLSTPASERRIHSSLMAKTLSAVISGSSLVPTVMGTDPTVRTGAFAVGRLAQSLINKKTTPQEIPLTDTELIELAGLVEDLQDQIIGAYYNYKSSLNQVKDTRARLILYNKNYSNAIRSNDILDIAVSSSLYDNMVLEEYNYTQLATKYHLELQRLAGKKVVDKLNLYQYNFNAAMFKSNAKPKKNHAKTVLKKSEAVVVPKIETKKTNFVQKIIPKKIEVKNIENKPLPETKKTQEEISVIKDYKQIPQNENAYVKPQHALQTKAAVQTVYKMQPKKIEYKPTVKSVAKTVAKPAIKTLPAKAQQAKPIVKSQQNLKQGKQTLPKMPEINAKKPVNSQHHVSANKPQMKTQNVNSIKQFPKSTNKIEVLNIMMPNIPSKTSIRSNSLEGKPVVKSSKPVLVSSKQVSKVQSKSQNQTAKPQITSKSVQQIKKSPVENKVVKSVAKKNVLPTQKKVTEVKKVQQVKKGEK